MPTVDLKLFAGQGTGRTDRRTMLKLDFDIFLLIFQHE